MRIQKIWKVAWAIVVLAIICCFAVPQSAVPHSDGKNVAPLWEVPGGNAQDAAGSIIRYGCFSCHAIPGIRRANGRVGPKLHEIRGQMYIGGVLANYPDNMIEWIKNPQRFSPGTAMPDLDVTEDDARDITAYLFKK